VFEQYLCYFFATCDGDEHILQYGCCYHTVYICLSLYLNIADLWRGAGKMLLGSWKVLEFIVTKRVGTLIEHSVCCFDLLNSNFDLLCWLSVTPTRSFWKSDFTITGENGLCCSSDGQQWQKTQEILSKQLSAAYLKLTVCSAKCCVTLWESGLGLLSSTGVCFLLCRCSCELLEMLYKMTCCILLTVMKRRVSVCMSQHASKDVEKMILGNKCDM